MNPATKNGEEQMSDKHKATPECGFDRNSSHSENRYVCACGWRDEHKNAAVQGKDGRSLYVKQQHNAVIAKPAQSAPISPRAAVLEAARIAEAAICDCCWGEESVFASEQIATEIRVLAATLPDESRRDGVLEEAAKECDKAASTYRAMKTDKYGEPNEDADQAEELAYCAELNARAIRALKASK